LNCSVLSALLCISNDERDPIKGDIDCSKHWRQRRGVNDHQWWWDLFLERTVRSALFDLRPCQHDNGYMDGRSQIKVHTAERTHIHSAQFSLSVTHPRTNQARRYLTSVTESPSKHWLPPRT